MPTPRAHGGAGAVHIPLVVPGAKGLNTQKSGALLGAEWATKLTNSIIDASGRLSARKGWESITSVAASEAFRNGIQFIKQDGTTQQVMTSDTKVWKSAAGDTWSDVTGSAVFTAGNWHLTNFNDFVIGFQAGYKALIYDGTTSSMVTDGDAPTGGIGTVAFGRVWQTSSDNSVLWYSDLLAHNTWGTTSFFDLSSVWPNNDTITAVSAFNNLLVIFGHNNIVVFSDPTGSVVGMTPSNMKVIDTIPGIGCYSQFSVQHVNGDLWFLDNSRELRSFNRLVVEQKSGEITKLSVNVSDRIRDTIDSGNFDPLRLRSGFSARNRFYLLSVPTRSGPATLDEVGDCFCFDTRGFLEDGAARVMGQWDQMVPTAILPQLNGDLYLTLNSVTGKLGTYTGGQDNGDSFRMIYESGWIDVTQQNYVLILKRISGRFFFNINTTIYLKWAFDFQTQFTQALVAFTIAGGTGLWGSGEWGIAEWGGGVDLQEKNIPGSGTGQYIKIGAEAVIDGGDFAIQEIDLLTKVGRLKG
jgi:hypothetical protein